MNNQNPVLQKTLSVAACDMLEDMINDKISEIESGDVEDDSEAILISGLSMLPGDCRRISKYVRECVRREISGFDITYAHLDEPYLELLDTLLNSAVTDLASELEEYSMEEEIFCTENDDFDDDFEIIDDDDDDIDYDDDDDIKDYPADKDDCDYVEDLIDDEDLNAVEEIASELSSIPEYLRDQIIIIEELVTTLNLVYSLPGYSALSLRHMNALLD